MDNPSDIPHNVKIDAPDAKEGETVGKGEKSVASADLKAGEYTVLLRRPRPPRGRHGGQAHGEVSRAGTACAR